MNRYVILFLVASGASVAAADELPLPPLPPDQPPMAQLAPIPDQGVQAPIALQSDLPSVNVRLYRSRPYDPSLGFTPGSRYWSTEDRRPIQTPGLSLSVPIQ